MELKNDIKKIQEDIMKELDIGNFNNLQSINEKKRHSLIEPNIELKGMDEDLEKKYEKYKELKKKKKQAQSTRDAVNEIKSSKKI